PLAVAALLDEGPQQVGLRGEVVVDGGHVEPAGARQPAHRRSGRPELADQRQGGVEDALALLGLTGVGGGGCRGPAQHQARLSGVNRTGRWRRASTRLESPRSIVPGSTARMSRRRANSSVKTTLISARARLAPRQ